MRSVDRAQVAVAARVERHFCHDSDAQPQLDIGLDHVRIERREHHVGTQAALLERAVDERAVGEREVVRDDRVRGDRLEGERLRLEQRVPRRHDDAAVPLVAGQGDERWMLGNLLGGEADVRLTVGHLRADLGGIALVDDEVHLWVAPLECGHRFRQCVARLRVGGCDRERAEISARVVFPCALQVRRVGKHSFGDGEHRPPRLRDSGEASAAAHEDLDSQLLLERLDLAAQSGLRGKERFCGCGDIQLPPRDLTSVAKLL